MSKRKGQIRADVQRMLDKEGVYIIKDDNADGCMVAVVSTGGHIIALSPTNELLPDRFLPSAIIHGPFP